RCCGRPGRFGQELWSRPSERIEGCIAGCQLEQWPEHPARDLLRLTQLDCGHPLVPSKLASVEGPAMHQAIPDCDRDAARKSNHDKPDVYVTAIPAKVVKPTHKGEKRSKVPSDEELHDHGAVGSGSARGRGFLESRSCREQLG